MPVVSTRALAESAVAGNHRVVTLDFFGDRDLRNLAGGVSLLRDLGRPFTPGALLAAGRQMPFDALVYGANLENHPGVVASLVRGRPVLGNSPRALGRVRDWSVLRQFCQDSEILYPATWLPGEERAADPSACWLVKPERGGGGHAIRLWDGRPLDAGQILQAFAPGRPASVLFAADGRRSVLLGVTEQLIGEKGLGADGFRWCGNMLSHETSADTGLLPLLEAIVSRFTRHFELRGVNGIDLVVDTAPAGSHRIYFLEVNPRYTAAMELAEKAYGCNIFSIHLAAIEGRLPRFSLADQGVHPCFGKAIVFAKQCVTIGQTDGWADRHRRDIPFAGDRIEAGRPVCSVFARGNDRAGCKARLLRRAMAVHREIGDQTEERKPCKHNLHSLPAAPANRRSACTREKTATLTARQ